MDSTPALAVPTASNLASLGAAVADDGPAAHHDSLVQLARTSRREVGPTAAADVLADVESPVVARQRALAVVTAGLLHLPRGRLGAMRTSHQPRWSHCTTPAAAATAVANVA